MNPQFHSATKTDRLRGAFYLLLAATSTLYVYRVRVLDVNLSPFRMVAALWLVAVMVGLVRGRIRLDTRFVLLAGLLAGLALIQGVDVLRSSLEGSRILRDALAHVTNLAIVALTALYVRNASDTARFANALVLASTLPLALSVYSLLSGSIPFEEALISTQGAISGISNYLVWRGGALRVAGGFYDPNFYGAYLVGMIGLAVYYHTFVRSSHLVVVITALNCVALFSTYSRTAWMGFAVLTLLAVSQAPSRKIAVVGLAGSAAVLAVLVWQLTGVDGELLGEAVARSVATESVSERRRFLEVGLAAIEQDPVFGTGSASLLRQELPHPTAHNVYVSWLARFGVMGGALYFTFLFVPLTFVLVRNVVPAGQRWLVIFTALPLLVMYVSYDFFPFLEYQYLLFGLWYTILLRQTIMPPSPSNSSPQADSRTKLPFQTQARGPNSAARDSLSPIVGHWKVIGLIAAAVTVLGAVAGSIVPPVWEATGLIRVGQVTTLGVGSSPVEPPQRTIARMRSRSFGERVLKAVSMSPDPRDPETALFWSSFTVAPYRDSDALIVKVRARSPELANQLAEAATEAISELHSELWTATVEVSKRHLAQKRTELEELKRKRDSLRERMRQANSSRAADVYTNMFLLTMLTQTDVEIRGAEQWLAQLQEMFTPIRTYPTSELASVRVSDTPVSPKRLAIIILSCVAGSLIGLLVALGLEWRRKLGEA